MFCYSPLSPIILLLVVDGVLTGDQSHLVCFSPFSFFWSTSIICPGCPESPPYPGDRCFPTKDDCEFPISNSECNNCGCDDGPSSVYLCGTEKSEEKIMFSCSSESGPGIWKPVHENSLCASSGESSLLLPQIRIFNFPFLSV